jgi:hypothetical protein
MDDWQAHAVADHQLVDHVGKLLGDGAIDPFMLEREPCTPVLLGICQPGQAFVGESRLKNTGRRKVAAAAGTGVGGQECAAALGELGRFVVTEGGWCGGRHRSRLV